MYEVPRLSTYELAISFACRISAVEASTLYTWGRSLYFLVEQTVHRGVEMTIIT